MKPWLPLALALALTGCARFSYVESGQHLTDQYMMPPNPPARENLLYFTYRVEGPKAILDSEKVALVFRDLSPGERNFRFAAGSFPVQIAGEGIFEGSVSCRQNFATATFRSRYENGATTLDFCGRTVFLADHARTATVASQTIDLSHGKREILVAKAE